MMKKLLLTILLLLIFSQPVAAKDPSAEEFYRQQYETSGADSIRDYLPEDVREYLQENGISPETGDWVTGLSTENVFTHIWQFLKSGAKAPLAGGAALLAVILISAALSSLDLGGGAASAALYATALSAAAVIAGPVFSVISAGINAMQGCSVFMMSFVPIFAVIVASAGGAATSASMSALLLGAAQTVNYISSFAVMPLMGGYLAISLSSSVSPVMAKTGIAEGMKKLSFWIMSLITTVFVGILSIQTAVNSSADSLTLKTAKFIVGSSFPMAGTALSEALTTVTASMGLLKTSVGIYAVLALALIFLPIIAELLLWRLTLTLNACVSDLLSLPKISEFLRCVDSVMSVLCGIILLTGAMFIISLTVVISMGKT